jgi:hypothetical protein
VSDLTAFRDHAAQMATAVHKPDCLRREHPWLKARPTCGHARCVTDADRALWARLAAEVDAYLTTDDTALWEDA